MRLMLDKYELYRNSSVSLQKMPNQNLVSRVDQLYYFYYQYLVKVEKIIKSNFLCHLSENNSKYILNGFSANGRQKSKIMCLVDNVLNFQG